MRNFKKLVKMTQKEMKGYLKKVLMKYYKDVIVDNGYVLAKGDMPIMITAHMDTVHKSKVRNIDIDKSQGKTYISSPQGIGGDDRCGIWVAIELIKRGWKPYVLFCEDEEIGRVGAQKFCSTENGDVLSEMKYIIELDRKGKNEVVFYDCGNKDFQKYIIDKTGYKLDQGSYSDITTLSPHGDVASVNISVGYYAQHTLNEVVVFEEMKNTIGVIEKLFVDEPNVEKFDFQEVQWSYPYGIVGLNAYKKGKAMGWYDDYDNGTYFEIEYLDDEGKTQYFATEAENYDEAIGKWLQHEPTLSFAGSFIDVFEYWN